MAEVSSTVKRDEIITVLFWCSKLHLLSCGSNYSDEDCCGFVKRKACQSLTAKVEAIKLRPASIGTLNKLEALASEEAILLRFDHVAEIAKEVNVFTVDFNLEEMRHCSLSR